MRSASLQKISCHASLVIEALRFSIEPIGFDAANKMAQ